MTAIKENATKKNYRRHTGHDTIIVLVVCMPALKEGIIFGIQNCIEFGKVTRLLQC